MPIDRLPEVCRAPEVRVVGMVSNFEHVVTLVVTKVLQGVLEREGACSAKARSNDFNTHARSYYFSFKGGRSDDGLSLG